MGDSSSIESTKEEFATSNCPLLPIPENLGKTVRKSRCVELVSCSFVYILIALTEQSWLRIIKVI